MTYRTTEDLAQQTGEVLRLLRGLVRRVAITLTDGARWQILGQRAGGGGDETADVEPFTGIGFYSRPPTSGSPEALVVAVGGAKTVAIAATRDEATRQLAAGNLADGETCVYNDKACIVVKADGTVEIRLLGGVALPLPTLQSLAALRDAIVGWVPVGGDGGAALKTALMTLFGTGPAWSWPTGTTVLKGQ